MRPEQKRRSTKRVVPLFTAKVRKQSEDIQKCSHLAVVVSWSNGNSGTKDDTLNNEDFVDLH